MVGGGVWGWLDIDRRRRAVRVALGASQVTLLAAQHTVVWVPSCYVFNPCLVWQDFQVMPTFPVKNQEGLD